MIQYEAHAFSIYFYMNSTLCKEPRNLDLNFVIFKMFLSYIVKYAYFYQFCLIEMHLVRFLSIIAEQR